MTGAIRSVFHPVIVVPDLDGALSFYRDLLGLRVTYAWEHDPTTLSRLTSYPDAAGRAATLAAPDGTEIELAEFRQPRGRPRVEKRWEDAGLSFVTLACSDLDELVGRLSAAGVPFVSEVIEQVLDDGAIVKVVYCFAPEGTTVTLVELPEGRRRLASQGYRE
jgi:catechol 2,3-dioxygenase-like lactoylglutathione lyase family enzyme